MTEGAEFRIAVVGSRGVPATYAGPETAVEQLGQRLVARGHEVTVFCRHHHYEGAHSPREWLGMRREMVGGIATKHLDTISHSAVAALRVTSDRFDAALVVIAGNLPVAALIRRRGVPVVFNVDGTDSTRDKWGPLARRYLRTTEALAGRAADVVVTDAEVLRPVFETGHAPVVVIPYGSERARRPPGAELARHGLAAAGYLLHVGRLEPEYGALDIVRAHAALEPRPPLVLVGDAPYAPDYRKSVHDAAAAEVVFTGFRHGAAYEELMSQARALVVAVRVGGTHPLVVEAMGFGLPVIAPDVAVMREMLGDHALYHRDVEELRAAMEQAWRDPDALAAIGARARERAATRYSWDAVTDAYEEAFTLAATRHRARGPRARSSRRDRRPPRAFPRRRPGRPAPPARS